MTAALSAAAMLFTNIISGGLALLAAVLIFAYYRNWSYKNFGGITGDTEGWFLQICELGMLIFAVVGEKIIGVAAL